MINEFLHYHKDEILTVIISGTGFAVSLTEINEFLQTIALCIGCCGGLIGIYKSIVHIKKLKK